MKQAIKDVVTQCKKEGLIVYLSFNKEYGFFTDEEGRSLVGFSLTCGSPCFGGNYVTNQPSQYGPGWGIGSYDFNNLKELLNAKPWGGLIEANDSWRYKTVDEYLKDYQKSSKFEQQ